MIEIAHRGYSELYKDNTIKAFDAAINSKFDIIEMDIVLTKDNEIIIYHDTFMDDKLIRNMTLHEIISKDTDIITLNEFYQKYDCNKHWIYLDVKGNDEYICIYLHKCLQRLSSTNKILIGSFNTLVLNRLHTYSSDYNLGLITENVLSPSMLQRYIDLYNIKFVSFHWTALNHINTRFLQMKRVFVFTYTCKNDSIYKFMSEFSPDGIVTNYKLHNHENVT